MSHFYKVEILVGQVARNLPHLTTNGDLSILSSEAAEKLSKYGNLPSFGMDETMADDVIWSLKWWRISSKHFLLL